MAKIEIKQTGLSKTQLVLDGKDISKMVTRFSFKRDANKSEVPILHLDILADDLSVDSVCVPALPEIYQPYYEKKKEDAD